MCSQQGFGLHETAQTRDDDENRSSKTICLKRGQHLLPLLGCHARQNFTL